MIFGISSPMIIATKEELRRGVTQSNAINHRYGQWLHTNDNEFVCSCCGYRLAADNNEVLKDSDFLPCFCPNPICEADMEEYA